MAACPVNITPLSYSRRRPLALTQRRLEANRRNAARSTGPRTADGKARVARNAIKHGFFAAQERWTPGSSATSRQRWRVSAMTSNLRLSRRKLRAAMAESYVRMAAMLGYENLAALKIIGGGIARWRSVSRRPNPIHAARLRAEREDCGAPGCGGRPSRARARQERFSGIRAASTGPFGVPPPTSKG